MRRLLHLPEHQRGVPALIASSFLFAVMALCTRQVAGRLSSGQVVSARFLIGLLYLGCYYALSGAPLRLGRPSLWAMRGLFGGVAVYFYFTSIEKLALGPAVLLNSCWPIWATLLSWWVLKERPAGHVGTGLLLSTAGAGLVIWATSGGGSAGGFHLGVGAAAGLVSAVLSGAAVTVVRALRNDTDSSAIFLSFNLFGLLAGLPLALADWRPVTWDVLWPLVGVGLTSVGAQMLFTYAFAYVTAAAGGVITQLTPAFSWVLGALLLDERVQPLAVAGAVVCVFGVLWGTVIGTRLFAGERQRA